MITNTNNFTILDSEYGNGRNKNVFLATVCIGNKSLNQEQMKHITVLLKSAAMLTRSHLRFHIITDTDRVPDFINSLTSDWPEEYRKRLSFNYHDATYPPGAEKGWRPCATLRLYFPDIFPELDAAIYLDTDMIFLRSPEDLWNEFSHFNDMQIAAMGPSNHWKTINQYKIPYYPPGGINSGLILMNMTRMRQIYLGIPGADPGWSSAMTKISVNYKNRLILFDNDIFNIFFNQ
ncbi:unnamed protein product, partial [Meganyctiphanes norvegica]